MKGRVLVVDDDPSMCQLLQEELSQRGMEATTSLSADEALTLVVEMEFDALVTDLSMKGMSGIELCSRVTASRPDIPVIVITAFGSLDTAVAAIRAGAHDFITKPFDTEAFVHTIQRALQYHSLREEVKRLKSEVARFQAFGELIGESPPMKRLFDLMSRIAQADCSVLISGETGTGKELVARAIHAQSNRNAGPFVAVNCSAMPEQLLESELFGHTKGAFTDAKSDRAGLFSQAEGGTLLLDEIGDMPMGLQPKILRALQERTARPVGSDSEVPFNARIFAATNKDIEAEVEEGKFRNDLLFRINVVHLHVPPLRSRGNDILLLAQHFIRRLAEQTGKTVRGISSQVAQKLLDYSWPGNVRELENCIERGVVLTRFEELMVEDLSDKIQAYSPSRVLPGAQDQDSLVPLQEIERRYILHVLDAVRGNKSEAARILEVDRRTLHRKLERYQQPSSGDEPEDE